MENTEITFDEWFTELENHVKKFSSEADIESPILVKEEFKEVYEEGTSAEDAAEIFLDNV